MCLGETSTERAEKYKQWLLDTVPAYEWRLITEAVQRGKLTGNTKFTNAVSEKLNRRTELRKPGRPQKISSPTIEK